MMDDREMQARELCFQLGQEQLWKAYQRLETTEKANDRRRKSSA